MADDKKEEKKTAKKLTSPKDQVVLALEKGVSPIEGQKHAAVVHVNGVHLTIEPGGSLNMTREQAQAIISQSRNWAKDNPCKGKLSIKERE